MGVEAGGRVRFLQSYAAIAEARARQRAAQLQLSVTRLTVKRATASEGEEGGRRKRGGSEGDEGFERCQIKGDIITCPKRRD